MTNNHTEPMKMDACREAFEYKYGKRENPTVISVHEWDLCFAAFQTAWNCRAEPSPTEVGSEGPTVEVLTEFINRIRVKHAANESIEPEIRQATNYLYGPRVSEAEIRVVEEMSQALSQQSPATVEGEALRTTWLSDGYTCINCGKGLSAHEDQLWCPALSSHPVSDDQQAKDAALLELCRKWNADELSDTDFAYAIDAALSTTKQGSPE